MARRVWISTLTLLAALGCSSGQSARENPADPNLALLGGDTTIFDDGDESFAYPARNLSADHRGLFQLGDGVFNRNWVAAPATPQGADGLGPTFNGRSCSACHANNGRGATPEQEGEPFLGLLLRLSVPGRSDTGGPKPEPTYGNQLDQFGILGVPGEGTPRVSYAERPGTYGDGAVYSLRQPTYSIAGLGLGPLTEGTLIGPRIAPQTVGLGLLEAVSESTILGFSAVNGGRANHVWDTERQEMALGRFGWKANQPTVKQQVLAAALNDIGITSAVFTTENCPNAQTACASAPPSLTQPELEPLKSDSLVVHGMAHAVPVRRNIDDPSGRRGASLFVEIGCSRCHVPEMVTGNLPEWPELSGQTIRPFTDLLLHDMGRELADDRPDFEATGTEWRTPPLWSLGLVRSINGHLFLLHDGRARGFEEAVLWHGGDAEEAREAFRTATKSDRESLVAFLSSL
jgi:CxxC motif-containing protein (DUF1111 family)